MERFRNKTNDIRRMTPPLQWITIYNPVMVKFDPKIHHRHSIRLKGYDYSQAGGYFVTIVAWAKGIFVWEGGE